MEVANTVLCRSGSNSNVCLFSRPDKDPSIESNGGSEIFKVGPWRCTTFEIQSFGFRNQAGNYTCVLDFVQNDGEWYFSGYFSSLGFGPNKTSYPAIGFACKVTL